MSEQQAEITEPYLDKNRIAENAFSELEIAVLEGIELARQAEQYFLNNLEHLATLLRIFEEEHGSDPLVSHYIKRLRKKFGLLLNDVPQ